MHSRFFIAIICVEDMKHYIEGFAQECYKQGLTEKQAYAALSVAMQKQASDEPWWRKYVGDSIYNIDFGKAKEDIIAALLRLGGHIDKFTPKSIAADSNLASDTSFSEIEEALSGAPLSDYEKAKSDYIDNVLTDANGDFIDGAIPKGSSFEEEVLRHYLDERAAGARAKQNKYEKNIQNWQYIMDNAQRANNPALVREMQQNIEAEKAKLKAAKEDIASAGNELMYALNGGVSNTQNLLDAHGRMASEATEKARAAVAMDDKSLSDKISDIWNDPSKFGQYASAWWNRDAYDRNLEQATQRNMEVARGYTRLKKWQDQIRETGLSADDIANIMRDYGVTVKPNENAAGAQPAPATQPVTPPVPQPNAQPVTEEEGQDPPTPQPTLQPASQPTPQPASQSAPQPQPGPQNIEEEKEETQI